MTKDYKTSPSRARSTKNKGTRFFSGLLVGFLLGIGASLSVAIYVTQDNSAFEKKVEPAPNITGKTESSSEVSVSDTALPEAQQEKEDRFTFYGILTDTEVPVTDQEVKQAAEKNVTVVPSQKSDVHKETYYLQVGAFLTEQEADNTKAKLALIGLEAFVQTATTPDKSVLHRVRVGPLANLNEISKARAELTRNGFDSLLIRINDGLPAQ